MRKNPGYYKMGFAHLIIVNVTLVVLVTMYCLASFYLIFLQISDMETIC